MEKNINSLEMMELAKTDKSQGWKNILRIIIPYIFVVGIFQLIAALIAGIDIMHIREVHQNPTQLLILNFMTMLSTVLIVWLFRINVDNKSFVSIGFSNVKIGNDILLGLTIGFFIMLFGFCSLILTKQLEFIDIQFNALNFLEVFGVFVCVAISEEVLCRGYILNNLMVSFNKYLALVISAIIFSLFHWANNGISLLSLFVLFLSGILLGLSYIYYKQLWFPIALHFSWNFFQGPVFGFNVSGIKIPTLIVSKYKTANIWNGGEFGFEGSVISLIFIVATLVLVYFLYRNKLSDESEKIIEPEVEKV